MSVEFTPLTPQVHQYWIELLRPEDEFLARLNREAAKAGIRSIGVAPDQGRFLTFLVRIIGADRVLEVGTLAGYSGICLARGLSPGGELVTCEVSNLHADFAEQRFAEAKLAATVRVLRGPALDHLSSLEDASFDLVFIDADKANYPAYLRQAKRLLRQGGLVCADNADAFGLVADSLPEDHPDAQNVASIRTFNRQLATDPDWEAVHIPLGDGMLVGRLTSRQ